jgi:hypothetical protein
MERFKQLNALSSDCDSCFHPFCTENDTFCALMIPTTSVACDHTICQRCLLERATTHLRNRRYLDCPCCLARNAFRVSSSRNHDPEVLFRVTNKTFRSGLLQVHRQPWNLSLELYPALMERIGRLPSLMVRRMHLTTTTGTNERLQLDRMKRLSTWILYDMIQGLVQVYDFSEKLSPSCHSEGSITRNPCIQTSTPRKNEE